MFIITVHQHPFVLQRLDLSILFSTALFNAWQGSTKHTWRSLRMTGIAQHSPGPGPQRSCVSIFRLVSSA